MGKAGRPVGYQQYTAKQFIDAIPGTGGIITHIANKVGCSWNTARKYIDKHPTVLRAWEDEREVVVDVAEVELIRKVKEGDAWAVKYMLSTIGKHRGFTEQHEVKQSGEVEVTVHVVYEDVD